MTVVHNGVAHHLEVSDRQSFERAIRKVFGCAWAQDAAGKTRNREGVCPLGPLLAAGWLALPSSSWTPCLAAVSRQTTSCRSRFRARTPMAAMCRLRAGTPGTLRYTSRRSARASAFSQPAVRAPKASSTRKRMRGRASDTASAGFSGLAGLDERSCDPRAWEQGNAATASSAAGRRHTYGRVLQQGRHA